MGKVAKSDSKPYFLQNVPWSMYFLGWMIGWLWLICEETWSYKVLNSRPHETVKWMLQILFWKRWLDWICYTFEYDWCQNCIFVCFNLISQGLKFPQAVCPFQPFPSTKEVDGACEPTAEALHASEQWAEVAYFVSLAWQVLGENFPTWLLVH